MEPVIAWTAELRRHVHPRRGGAPPRLPDDPSAAFARMLEAYERSAAAWTRSPALAAPELGPRLRAALDRMKRAVAGKIPPVATPEVEGTLLALLSSGSSRLEGGEVLSYWVATAGLSFAIEALAASRGLWIDTPGGVPRMIFVAAVGLIPAAVGPALKKDVKTLAGQQILRLELAMCSRRRWEPGVFRMFFAGHPLLQHLVKRLVWGAWDGEQHLRATFRVVEDGSCAGPADDTWELPEDVHVGLIHRLDLTSELAARWGEIFADYEILQPFPQLGREVWTIEEGEREARELHRLAGATVKTGRLLSLMTRHGWRRDTDMEGGVITCLSKPLPGGAREALLEIEPGIYLGAVMEEPEQTLEPLILEGKIPFGALDPVTFSELVRDLESLR